MNIFRIESCPLAAAQSQCDKHVVKMPLESAQMLSTAIIRHGGVSRYKPAYSKHPCTLWAGDNRLHFEWLVDHAIALCNEYTARYDRIHKSMQVIWQCFEQRHLIPVGDMQPQPLCMPDQYKVDCVVESYRNFYRGDKAYFATWKRNRPAWFERTKP